MGEYGLKGQHQIKTESLLLLLDVGGKAVCLICQDVVSVFKECNVKRHFHRKHVNFGSNMPETELQQKANGMLKSLKQQQTIFVKRLNIQEAATKASFVLAYNIAKNTSHFQIQNF